MTVRWGALIIGAIVGAIAANMRTSSAKGGDGTVAPTDQNKRAGWSQ